MMHILKLLLVFTSLAISACSWFMPYRPDIQQGNIIEQEALNRVKIGMRKDQVQFILGTPMLMDPYHANRWDYIHTLRKGHDKMTQKRITFFFKDDALVKISGDYRLNAPVNKPQYDSDVLTVPLRDYEEDDTWYSWLMFWLHKSGSEDKQPVGEAQPHQANHSAKAQKIIQTEQQDRE